MIPGADVRPARPANGGALPLTGLRGLLAAWVVVFHFGRDLVPELLRPLAAAGYQAVDVFFVLSGYVLAKRYAAVDLLRREARRAFWRRRLARVYPLYLLSLVIGVVAAWPRAWTDLREPRYALRAILQLLLLNAWSSRAMFAHNWAAWSLSVEVFFYAIFPFVLSRLVRLSRRGLVMVLIVAWGATFAIPSLYTAIDPDHFGRPIALGDEALGVWYLKFFPLLRLPELLAGAAAARLAGDGSARKAHPARALAIIAAWGALVASPRIPPLVPYAYACAGVFLPLVVALIVTLDHRGASLLSTRGATALGRSSYAVYILHVPLFFLAARFDPALRDDGAHVAAYVAALTLLALGAHAGIEEPLLQRASRSRTASS